MVPGRAVLDVPRALVGWVAMLIVTREGDRRCRLSTSGRALAAPVYLKKIDTPTRIAAGFGISVGTAHAYVHSVVALLARRAPVLTAALRSSDAGYVALDGTLVECDRVGDSRADYTGEHRRHGVNLQAITTPEGTLVRISPALAGRVHDLTAARRHRIIATCVRLGILILILANMAYQGAGDTVTVPHRRRPGKDLNTKQKSFNRAHSRLRRPVERAIARIKTWHILHKARLNPNKPTSITKAILTLETHR
ncbi:transposase [Streptomyces virginiae]|uniref:Transposase n=1 Tax=Streptomyces virginiae TaxID=1961 RepID=A0A0L8MYG8_STRVG|nr:transposase family protein [Streptomyces virginiae]KOG55481.1 transposase [Streptomyces virginiae]